MGWLSRLIGKGDDKGAKPDISPTEFEGFWIKPAPKKQNGNYVTAGYIQRIGESGETEEQYFIRADTHADFESACEHAVFKGQQIIRESGEQIFKKS